MRLSDFANEQVRDVALEPFVDRALRLVFKAKLLEDGMSLSELDAIEGEVRSDITRVAEVQMLNMTLGADS